MLRDLIEGLDDLCPYNQGNIHDGMMLLEWCQRAANNGMMCSWCEKCIDRIRGGLAKLANYKSSSHRHAIRTDQNIQGTLRDWLVINSWREDPPRKPKHG